MPGETEENETGEKESEGIEKKEPADIDHSSSEETIQNTDEGNEHATIVQTETGDLEPDRTSTGIWIWILSIGAILVVALLVIVGVCAGVVMVGKKNKKNESNN